MLAEFRKRTAIEQERQMAAVLHMEFGYNFFEIPRLTLIELTALFNGAAEVNEQRQQK